tara:strand:- start:451 stop:1218 length:768 start_codon:yes stop_codon:yes gene_type:complete
MNRITNLFKEKKNNILSIYFTAGFPSLNDTIEILKTLDETNVDLIEIGMPFSDPIADGPIIQNSSNVAINNGMNLNVLFDQLSDIRNITDIPIVLMGYINPVYQFGYKKFIQKLVKCDIDGVILPDLPLEDYRTEFQSSFNKYNLSFISLISPNTSLKRINQIDMNSKGFIYVVSSSSITGNNKDFNSSQIEYFKKIKKLNLYNPTIIGFGIFNHKTFKSACKYSNGAIIGTNFIKSLNKNNLRKSIKNYINSIR